MTDKHRDWFDSMVEQEAGAWQKVLNAVPGAIARDAKNPHFGYKFVSIDKFAGVIGPILREHGFAVHMHELDCRIVDTGTNNRGEDTIGMIYKLSLIHI